MSTFDDASLVMIPSGYKASKVYSVKPTDGTGDLTFTRSLDTATRVGPDGLIEKVRTNLFLQSNAFTNAAWGKIGGVTITGGQSDPEGGSNAFLYERTLAFDYIVQSLASDSYTISIYAKANASNFLRIASAAVGDAVFNLSTGTISASSSSTPVITSVGNGWYRCSVYFPTASTQHYIQNYPVANGAAGVGSIYIYKAQAELGDIATDYIATTTAAVSVGMLANVPRLDYLGGGCPKLLLEPQRTNLQIYSENSGLWQQPADGLTVVYNTTETLDPAGFNGAEKVTFSSGNGRMFEAVANAIGSVTMSAFVKAGTGNTIRLRTTSASIFVDFNLTTQTITSTAGTGTITNYGNGWYRVTATGTSATTPEVAQYVFPNTAGQFVYFYGAQFEAGAYATSYIPTLGAAVTRSADAASKTGISALIGQTEGTIFLDFNLQTPVGNDYVIGQIYNSSTPANTIYFYVSTFNFFQAIVDDTGGNQVNMFSPSALAQGNHKLALAYKANDFVFYIDGVQIATDTSGTVPTCNSVGLIDYVAAPIYLEKSAVNQYLLFKTRLTNAQLAELTTI